tara:strand:+ start:12267 stop:12743 length:477 start_codon:yes stop_codon:yes gene_type:complete
LQYRLVNIWLCVCVGFVGLYQLHLTEDNSYTCFKEKLPFCSWSFVYLLCIICVNKIVNSVKKTGYFFLRFLVLAIFSSPQSVIKAKPVKMVSSPEHFFSTSQPIYFSMLFAFSHFKGCYFNISICHFFSLVKPKTTSAQILAENRKGEGYCLWMCYGG